MYHGSDPQIELEPLASTQVIQLKPARDHVKRRSQEMKVLDNSTVLFNFIITAFVR